MTVTSDTPPPAGTISVYQAIGGRSALSAAVDGFFWRLLADPVLGPFFPRGAGPVHRAYLVTILGEALGGPERYRGPDIAAAHAGRCDRCGGDRGGGARRAGDRAAVAPRSAGSSARTRSPPARRHRAGRLARRRQARLPGRVPSYQRVRTAPVIAIPRAGIVTSCTRPRIHGVAGNNGIAYSKYETCGNLLGREWVKGSARLRANQHDEGGAGAVNGGAGPPRGTGSSRNWR
jgi:hypothetical protein